MASPCSDAERAVGALLTAAAAAVEQGLTATESSRFVADDVRFILDGSTGAAALTSSQLAAFSALLAQLAGEGPVAAALGQPSWLSVLLAGLRRSPDGTLRFQPSSAPSGSAATGFALGVVPSAPSAVYVDVQHLLAAAAELHDAEHTLLAAMAGSGAGGGADDPISKRLLLLAAGGLLPALGGIAGGAVHVPTAALLPVALASCLQVLAMDDTEFWAYRASCDFFTRKAVPGGFGPWLPVRGAAYIVTNAKAKGGQVTVHAHPDAVAAVADAGSGGATTDSEGDLSSEEEDAGLAAHKRRRQGEPAAGAPLTVPATGAAATKLSGGSLVAAALGSMSPESAFAAGLLKVDAPLVPLPQPWATAGPAVDGLQPAWPAAPATLAPQLAAAASHGTHGAMLRRLEALLQLLPVAEVEQVAPPAAAAAAVQQAPTPAAAPAPSQFAFAVKLPGAGGAVPLPQPADADSGEADEETGAAPGLAKFCVEEGEDGEEADVREGAYVILQRALQLQAASLTTAGEAAQMTTAAVGRAKSGAAAAVRRSCDEAAGAVAAEAAALTQLLRRMQTALPDLWPGDGDTSDSSSAAGEAGEGGDSAGGDAAFEAPAPSGGRKRRRW